MKALIDGDVLRYRIGFASEETVWDVLLKRDEEFGALRTFSSKAEALEWIGEDDTDVVLQSRVIPSPIQNCLHSVKLQIEQIIKGSLADEYKVYLSGSTNFRNNISVTRVYKGNRPDRKPYHFENITNYLVERFGAVISDGQEADDDMSIEQWNDKECVICTIDKDLDMVPDWHYNFVKDIRYYVDEDTANEWFYCQLVMGDTTDNIQGIPGAGKKKAYEVLKECQTEMERYQAVRDLYMETYKDGDTVLLEMARLLWMRQHPDQLWLPPVQLHT